MFRFLIPKELRSIVDVLTAVAAFVPPIKKLLEGACSGNSVAMKRAYYDLEREAELRVAEKLRGG
jgi:hypothetical protein